MKGINNMFKNFINYLKFVKQSHARVLITIIALLIIPAAIGMAEWYPQRPVFDYNNPADRVGSMDGPVFNSFINTPSYGDERAFVDARKSDQTAAGSYKDQIVNVTQGSDEIVVRMYVHNNANQSTNDSGVGVARNTRVRVFVPSATDTSLRARGYISADNATPQLVEDTVDFTDSVPFGVEYKPGSAILYNNGPFSDGVALNDSIVTDAGAPIGWDALNGNLPGCFQYEAVVQVTLKVKSAESSFEKEVRSVSNDSDWAEQVSAEPGDTVKWLLTIRNSGTTNLTNLKVRDVLPPYVTVVPGSVIYKDSNFPDGHQLSDNALFSGGVELGTYGPGAVGYITFETVIGEIAPLCEETIPNNAYFSGDGIPEELNQASVVITDEDCNPVEPEYSCDALSAVSLGNREYRFTVRSTAENGATLTGYRINFGDDDVVRPFRTNQDVFSINHTYVAHGTYTITAIADFEVNGQRVSDQGPQCTTQVTIEEEPEPIFECVSLTANALDRNSYEFTARARAERGAQIVGYSFDFGDGNVQDVQSTETPYAVEHEYAEPGNYNVSVVAVFDVNGEMESASGPQCEVEVGVDSPVAVCEELQAIEVTRRSYQFIADARADNGAEIVSYTFQFGDGESEVVQASADRVSVEHEYPNFRSYAANVTVRFLIDGEEVDVTADECAVNIEITPPTDRPNPEEPTPGELPNTGAGGVLGMVIASSTLAAATSRWFESRKGLK